VAEESAEGLGKGDQANAYRQQEGKENSHVKGCLGFGMLRS